MARLQKALFTSYFGFERLYRIRSRIRPKVSAPYGSATLNLRMRIDWEVIHIVMQWQREITRILKRNPKNKKNVVFWFWFSLIKWLPPYPDRMRWLLLCRPRWKIWPTPAYSTGKSCKRLCQEISSFLYRREIVGGQNKTIIWIFN